MPVEPLKPSSAKPVIGITGGIGSGKSEVAAAFASLGCGVIDADALSRQAMTRPEVIQRLVGWWGPGVLRADGAVDRAAVGRIVFSDPAQRRRLEGLIHPLVAARRMQLRDDFGQNPQVTAIVEDAPLLMEVGIDRSCDVLVYVDTPRAVRLARLKQSRRWDEAELARREKNQLPLDIKRERADYVVVNDAGVPELLGQVRRVLSEILNPPRA